VEGNSVFGGVGYVPVPEVDYDALIGVLTANPSEGIILSVTCICTQKIPEVPAEKARALISALQEAELRNSLSVGTEIVQSIDRAICNIKRNTADV
jgi:hypothetical protein